MHPHQQRALEAITAETQRLRDIRDRIRYLEARRDMMAHVDVAQPVSNVQGDPRLDNYNNRVSLDLLQLAMRMSSSPPLPDPFHLVDIASSPQRLDPLGRHRVLPSGPSYMNALPSDAMVARLPPSPMISVPIRRTSKRKLENVLDHTSAFASAGRPIYQEQSKYTPTTKNQKGSKGGGSFPLPPTTEPKPLSIPLTSYWKLWEKGQGEIFRKRIHNSQVTILDDTSITGQYSQGRRMT
jgi:hypothetical protein